MELACTAKGVVLELVYYVFGIYASRFLFNRLFFLDTMAVFVYYWLFSGITVREVSMVGCVVCTEKQLVGMARAAFVGNLYAASTDGIWCTLVITFMRFNMSEIKEW